MFANVRADTEEFMNSTYPEMQANFKRYFGNRHFTPKKYVYITTKKQKLNFLKENILVIKYVAREISKEDLEEVLKEVLAKEEVEEKYVRDFLNCSMIDRNSKNFEIDKIMLIYKYGSKKARKIAVDEKLKMI